MIAAPAPYGGASSGGGDGAIAGAATAVFGVVETFWFGVAAAACDAFGGGDCHPSL